MTYTFTDEELARLREAVDRAPSVFGQRPWELKRATDEQGHGVNDRLELYSTPDEYLGQLLPREVVISCGAALYNLRLAIQVAGREPSVWLLPGLDLRSGLLTTVASRRTLLASIEVMPGRAAPPTDAEQELYEALWLRRTDRRPYEYVPVPPPILVEMEIAAARERSWLRILPDRQRRQALRAVAAANKKINEEKKLARLLADPASRVLPDPNSDERARIGFGPKPAGRRGGKAPPTRPIFWLRDRVPFEDRLATPPIARRRTQLMALSTDDDRPLDWLRAGEALQHALLNGTRFSMSVAGGRSTPYRQQLYYAPLDPHRLWRRPAAPTGYAVEASFLTQSLELASLRDLDPATLAALGLADEIADLKRTGPRKDQWRWPWRSYYTEIPQIVLRVGYAPVRQAAERGDSPAETQPIPQPKRNELYVVPIPRSAYDDDQYPVPHPHPEDDEL